MYLLVHISSVHLQYQYLQYPKISAGSSQTHPVDEIFQASLVYRLNENNVILPLVLDEFEIQNRTYVRMLESKEKIVQSVLRRWANAQRAVSVQRYQSQKSVGLQHCVSHGEPVLVHARACKGQVFLCSAPVSRLLPLSIKKFCHKLFLLLSHRRSFILMIEKS